MDFPWGMALGAVLIQGGAVCKQVDKRPCKMKPLHSAGAVMVSALASLPWKWLLGDQNRCCCGQLNLLVLYLCQQFFLAGFFFCSHPRVAVLLSLVRLVLLTH